MFPVGHRLGKNVFSETEAKVANYNSKLDTLMENLRDRALLHVQSNMQDAQHSMQQTREDRNLDCLAYASKVGLITGKKCLDGTRTEILNEVFDWINDADPAVPHIFWLHGQAGKGKSAIAHTISLQAQNLGVLGSCFCFTRVRQAEGFHTKLFPTIACDLADRDLRLRTLLAETIANNHCLRDTADIAQQWQKFIVEPLSQLQGPSTGTIVVVIDALDESGAEITRAPVLGALTASDAKLPGNIRILVTSRPLVDIQEALHASQHVRTRSLDDIDTESTTSDIRLYVSDRLKSLGNTFSDADIQQVATRSGGVFEWARLACDFIFNRIGVIAKKRLDEIMSHTSADGRTLLDEMYTTFLKEFTQGSSEVLGVFQSVMRQILWSKKPLSISALNFLRGRFPRTYDRYSVEDTLRVMASLLSGTNDTSTPVRPLHASFYDFLLDENRSREFFIPKGDVHRDLAVASLSVMRTCLRFNICDLETSYMANAEVADLDKKVEMNIPQYMLYACQFWAKHLEEAEFVAELAELVGQFINGEQVLFWLEVLGVSKLIKEAYWTLVSAEEWFQVGCLIIDMNAIILIMKQQGQMKYKEVMMVIKDVLKFVQNFAGMINKSTPHLYLSGLAFSPSQSIMTKHLDNFSGVAKITMGKQNDWPRNEHILQCSSSVLSIAFSPDGRVIVSCLLDDTIQVWDAQTGGQVGNPLQGHTCQINSVAFSPDGRHIVSGSSDKTIRVWDAQIGGQVGNPLQGHTDQVHSVAFSPDGRYIVSGSFDKTIRVWDAQTGGQVGNPFQGHTDQVQSVAFSPDGRYIVSGSSDKIIRVWDAQTGGQVGNPLQGHTSSVSSAAFSPNGRYIVSGSNNTIQVWDAQTGGEVGNPLEGHTDWVWSVAFSPDGRHIVSGSSDKTIRVWDVYTGGQVGNPLQEDMDSVLSVAFSSNGHIVSGCQDKTIQVWDAQAYSNPIGDGVQNIIFLPINFSPSPSHALQQPESLFIDSLSGVQGDLLLRVDLQQDGWVVGPNGKLLLWVPPTYQPISLYSPWTNLVIPRVPELDLSRMKHGPAWHECYSNITTT